MGHRADWTYRTDRSRGGVTPGALTVARPNDLFGGKVLLAETEADGVLGGEVMFKNFLAGLTWISPDECNILYYKCHL